MIAPFEQDPFLGAGGLVVNPPGLLRRHKVFGAVDHQERAADLGRQPFERAAAV